MKKLLLLLFFSLTMLGQVSASTPGQKVLREAQRAVHQRKLGHTSCWVYVDEIFRRAGYPRAKRGKVYHRSKYRGPYAPRHLYRKGDWIYFLNRSNGNIEHSGIFVRWVNKARLRAQLISYSGLGRVPGRVKTYTLSHVYRVYRAVDRNVGSTSKKYSRKFRQKRRASGAGRKVVQAGKELLKMRKIVVGTSLDYVRTIYWRAGYPSSKRRVLFNSNRGGPYSNRALRSGDWVCFVNHSYKKRGHCALFVNWVNASKRLANTISYAGENRRVPARWKHYDLSHVYQIVRPK